MAETTTQDTGKITHAIPNGMKTPFVLSVGLHFFILILAITGVPLIEKPLPLMSTAVPVEILPIAEMTTTNKAPSKPLPKPPEEVKEKPKEKPPAPPKVEAVEPPKDVPKPKKAEVKPKPKPVVPPPPTEKLEKPKPKPEEKPKEKPEEQEKQQEDFAALLKNLQDSAPEVTEDVPESKDAKPVSSPAPDAPFSETLTMSETDALSQQLSRCWSIQAGARYAEGLIVEVRMSVSPDRKAQSAVVVDQIRYNSDSYFRAAADSALRAIYSPQCEILNLPPDKYELWKDIVVTFDPRQML